MQANEFRGEKDSHRTTAKASTTGQCPVCGAAISYGPNGTECEWVPVLTTALEAMGVCDV